MFKNYIEKYFIIILIPFAISCRKNDNGKVSACSYLVSDNAAVQLVSKQDLDSIRYLLDKNQIIYSNLQFFQYSDIGFRYIRSYQYVNNLEIHLYIF